MEKETKLSCRLTDIAYENLNKIVEVRGTTKSEVVNRILERVPIFNLGNIDDLGVAFCELTDAINNCKKEELEKRGDEICQSILDALSKIEQINI